MLVYPISIEERDTIEALYFEKNAKNNLLTLLSSRKDGYMNNDIFERVYNEAVQANIAFNSCFNTIMVKHAPKNLYYKDARIEFVACELVIEEA